MAFTELYDFSPPDVPERQYFTPVYLFNQILGAPRLSLFCCCPCPLALLLLLLLLLLLMMMMMEECWCDVTLFGCCCY